MHPAPTRFERTNWPAELERLSAADAAGTLGAAGLARLGLALELTGHTDDAVRAWDRARSRSSGTRRRRTPAVDHATA